MEVGSPSWVEGRRELDIFINLRGLESHLLLPNLPLLTQLQRRGVGTASEGFEGVDQNVGSCPWILTGYSCNINYFKALASPTGKGNGLPLFNRVCQIKVRTPI